MNWVAQWILSLIITRKYSGSIPTIDSSSPFFQLTGHDLHDVTIWFRRSPSGYATRDSLPFSNHHSIEQDLHQEFFKFYQGSMI